MSSKKTKHDPFFSRSLELLPIAQAFFQQHIPAHLQENISSQAITRIDRKNTDYKLKQRQRDILYKTTLYGTERCYLSCEHQSQELPTMAFRLLQYHLDTLSMHYQAGYTTWPVVINLLFYHGKTSPYPHPCESTHYYQRPAVGNQQFYFKFYLVDITTTSDEAILAHGICAPMELLLKHSRDALFELPLAAYRPVFQACIDQVGDEYLATMLTYVAYLSNLEVGEKMFNFIQEIFYNKKEVAMTYAAKLKLEGRREGKKEGKQEGRLEGKLEGIKEIARNMLIDLGLDLPTVQKATKLPKDELEKLLLANK